MIHYRIGDITSLPVDSFGENYHCVILQGVNCRGVMGSGVAKAIYEEWPIVKERYLKLEVDMLQLGNIQTIRVAPDITVINCFTQEFFGSDGGVYGSPDAIKIALKSAKLYCLNNAIYEMHMPRIGCGLAGLDWDRQVEPIVEELAGNIDIYVYDLPQ